MNIEVAASMIRELSPLLADIFVSRPFNRRSVVAALFEKMVADGDERAYRVRVLLHRLLDDISAIRAMEPEL